MFTRFMDMCSGGSQKEKWEKIYIEAPWQEAKTIFYNRFNHNPERVTCTCCGEDYSISERNTIEEATDYDRRNIWSSNGKLPELSIEEFLNRPEILIIYKSDIKDEEKNGNVPEQGYVWID